ncbi:hypothetical protein CHKEEEPN_3332 [Methylorubrum podarium]|nr:hypothetical protein CHKEEEPN_3332 [Methylorubrum podarium]
MVDRDHAGLDARPDPVRAGGGAGIGVGREPVGQAVGLGQRLLVLREATDRGDRPERLLVHDPGLVRHVGEDGGLEEVAAIADAAAAGEQPRTLGLGVGHERLHRLDPAAVDEGAHLRLGIEAVADLERLRGRDEAVDEAVVDAVLHEEAGRGDADLTGIAVLVGGEHPHGGVDVGVVEHDRRGVAAELHRRPLHVLARERRELLADRGRAGEGDLADHRMRDEIAGDFGRIAVDEGERIVRHARVEEGAHQFRAGGRGVLRALEDDGTAGAERRRELSHRLVDRKIPRREGRHGADGLAGDDLQHALGAGGNDPAIGAPPLFREPLDDVGGDPRLDARLGERLALLDGHGAGDRLRALAHQRRGPAQHLGPVEGGDLAPGGKAAFGRCKRLVEIGPRRHRDAPDRLTGGGVEDGQGLAAASRAPPAGNVERNVEVHEPSPWKGRLSYRRCAPMLARSARRPAEHWREPYERGFAARRPAAPAPRHHV